VKKVRIIAINRTTVAVHEFAGDIVAAADKENEGLVVGSELRCFPVAVLLLRFVLEQLIVRRFQFSQYGKAFYMIRDRTKFALKVMFINETE